MGFIGFLTVTSTLLFSSLGNNAANSDLALAPCNTVLSPLGSKSFVLALERSFHEGPEQIGTANLILMYAASPTLEHLVGEVKRFVEENALELLQLDADSRFLVARVRGSRAAFIHMALYGYAHVLYAEPVGIVQRSTTTIYEKPLPQPPPEMMMDSRRGGRDEMWPPYGEGIERDMAAARAMGNAARTEQLEQQRRNAKADNPRALKPGNPNSETDRDMGR